VASGKMIGVNVEVGLNGKVAGKRSRFLVPSDPVEGDGYGLNFLNRGVYLLGDVPVWC
jgi:hypothetical protein